MNNILLFVLAFTLSTGAFARTTRVIADGTEAAVATNSSALDTYIDVQRITGSDGQTLTFLDYAICDFVAQVCKFGSGLIPNSALKGDVNFGRGTGIASTLTLYVDTSMVAGFDNVSYVPGTDSSQPAPGGVISVTFKRNNEVVESGKVDITTQYNVFGLTVRESGKQMQISSTSSGHALGYAVAARDAAIIVNMGVTRTTERKLNSQVVETLRDHSPR